MRGLLTVLMVSGMAWGQAADTTKPVETAPPVVSVGKRDSAESADSRQPIRMRRSFPRGPRFHCC